MHGRTSLSTQVAFAAVFSTLASFSSHLWAQDPPIVGRELQPAPVIDWKELTTLPAGADGKPHAGLAGLFAGGHGLHLLIAGGTGFLAGSTPLEATKLYKKEILVLQAEQAETGPKYVWKPAGVELPQELAHGGSINTGDGFLMIGGRNATACVADCRHLAWDEAGQKVVITDYPKLPRPLAHTGVALLGSVIYVAGGVEQPGGRPTRNFLSLDLTQKNDPAAFVWKGLAAWDGPGRTDALLVSGFDGDSEDIYICGGRDPGGR